MDSANQNVEGQVNQVSHKSPNPFEHNAYGVEAKTRPQDRQATRPCHYCANCYSETTLRKYADSQRQLKAKSLREAKKTNSRRLLHQNPTLIASLTGENDYFPYNLSVVFRSSLVFAVHDNLETDKCLIRLSVRQSGKDYKAFKAGGLCHYMSLSSRQSSRNYHLPPD